jgi:acyl carrier protein
VEEDLQKITTIIRNLFDEYDGPVTRELSARDVAQWDSLANVQFVVMVEQTFGVRFHSRDIEKFKNLGELLDIAAQRREK